MRISILFIGMILAASSIVGCGGNASASQNNEKAQDENPAINEVKTTDGDKSAASSSTISSDTIPENVRKIMKVYPDFNISYSDNHLVFTDGTTIVYDDGREKSFVEKLDDCDVEDMFSMTYDRDATIPAYLNDCGRGRSEQLYKKMYGNNEAEVKNNLVDVEWFGQKIPFTKVNGANLQLAKVATDLKAMPEMKKYLTKASSFYWRKVRGANRQSAHSYGIAIDINTTYSNYWLWSNPKCSETDKLKYENQIPLEIVKVFEKHGFVWGGRWYHYDTMHFEYRPELVW